ncbi:MAG: hypothetical protein WC483_06455 [Candidatus Paceibacterota bacterium]
MDKKKRHPYRRRLESSALLVERFFASAASLGRGRALAAKLEIARARGPVALFAFADHRDAGSVCPAIVTEDGDKGVVSAFFRHLSSRVTVAVRPRMSIGRPSACGLPYFREMLKLYAVWTGRTEKPMCACEKRSWRRSPGSMSSVIR